MKMDLNMQYLLMPFLLLSFGKFQALFIDEIGGGGRKWGFGVDSKLACAFKLASGLIKWTQTAPVDSKSQIPVKGKKKPKPVFIKICLLSFTACFVS